VSEGPRDALSQLEYCLLLHNWRKITFDQKDLPFHVV